MHKLGKNNKTDGKCSAKTGKSIEARGACPDDSCEDLLDGPLPAG